MREVRICRVAIYHSTHSAPDCRGAEVSSRYQPSCVGEMFYKLIILLSGSSAVLLCSGHATLHLRYTLSSPVHNRARSSTFVIWCHCAFSLPAAAPSTGDTQVPIWTNLTKIQTDFSFFFIGFQNEKHISKFLCRQFVQLKSTGWKKNTNTVEINGSFFTLFVEKDVHVLLDSFFFKPDLFLLDLDLKYLL